MESYTDSNITKQHALVHLLVTWYEEEKRDLVWRDTRNPYCIWISEVMAQQTRIAAVLPYYERFMRRFPTLSSLAQAPIDDVLKLWEGLGYYSRAHNLSKAAKILFFEYGGSFPETAEKLITLPGIGAYTAGAIASICFNQAVPAIDGNVLRVFSRLMNNEMDIQTPQTKKLLSSFLKEMIPSDKPGTFNQAVMELGALICTPKSPLCGNCPVQPICLANTLNKQLVLPVKTAKKAVKENHQTVLLIINTKNEILLRLRDEKLLKGLWIFYMIEQKLNIHELIEHLHENHYKPIQITAIGSATHTFTHLKWLMEGYVCYVEDSAALDGYHFVSLDQIKNIAMPSAIQFFRDWLLEESCGIL